MRHIEINPVVDDDDDYTKEQYGITVMRMYGTSWGRTKKKAAIWLEIGIGKKTIDICIARNCK